MLNAAPRTAAPIRTTSSTTAAAHRRGAGDRPDRARERSSPQGFGEVVLAPVAPAVAQALLAATGRRLDAMPFPDDAFLANA
jgi:hypothetical protein